MKKYNIALIVICSLNVFSAILLLVLFQNIFSNINAEDVKATKIASQLGLVLIINFFLFSFQFLGGILAVFLRSKDKMFLVSTIIFLISMGVSAIIGKENAVISSIIILLFMVIRKKKNIKE